MPVEPDALAAQHEARDRPDPEQIETPGERPPGEVGLPIPRKQKRAKQAQGPRDGGLKQGGVELDVGGWGYRTLDHSRNKRPESTRRNIPWRARLGQTDGPSLQGGGVEAARQAGDRLIARR